MAGLKTKWECVKQSLDQFSGGNGAAGEPGHIYLLNHANGKKVAIREETILNLAAGEIPILTVNEDGISLLTDKFHHYKAPRDDWKSDWEEWIPAMRADPKNTDKRTEETLQHMNGKIAWIQQAEKDVEAGLIPYLVQNKRGEWGMKQMARAEPTENNLL